MNMQVPPPAADRDMPAHETDAGAHTARRYLVGGVALILVLGGFYYWSHAGNEPARRGAIAAPVRVATVVQRDMPVVEHTIGTVVANSTVSVTARVQGQLTKAFFTEGQMVKTNDLLFQIDPAPYQAAYDSAVATLATTRAKAGTLSTAGQPERHLASGQRRRPGRLSPGQGQSRHGAASIWNSPKSARRWTARPVPSCCSRAIWFR